VAAPSSYTETTLAEYALSVLGQVAASIGWTNASKATEVVNDTLLELGVDDIATVSGSENIRHLRVVARYHAWKAAAELTSGKYDFDTGDSGSFKRSQLHQMAVENAEKARAEANEAGLAAGVEAYPGYEVTTVQTVFQEPYQPGYLTDADIDEDE
jgi:hypothetical protein